ncbi:hypothetical protein PSU4_36660 [Pseudonocardia sulfidoxydans NBRC 16205]|uniref:DUF7455 domain-containing protein n=1 Tax=Pseudonocardia sulfidoxydans NBRC 16205 TaxID=1223511 RepID=A0A511DIR6_9PSEU|nr:hypothetical protein [Pseudonocardia sulfidoxydans]GEL24712.1 hypothetical protein PSU4_36660 [Pseudonocardia sulfidoxydans NBRC 16205]
MNAFAAATATTSAVAEAVTRPLTRADRCDACGAAARVRVVLPTSAELLFCGHHARRHAPRLREIGAELVTDP